MPKFNPEFSSAQTELSMMLWSLLRKQWARKTGLPQGTLVVPNLVLWKLVHLCMPTMDYTLLCAMEGMLDYLAYGFTGKKLVITLRRVKAAIRAHKQQDCIHFSDEIPLEHKDINCAHYQNGVPTGAIPVPLPDLTNSLS
jgi:hypothetical protein